MSDKKYELLEDEYIKVVGRKVFRIRALRSFGNIKEGDKGGFIQSEKNLYHNGDCWVGRDAIVCDDAIVSGNALVTGDAFVYGAACIMEDAIVMDQAHIGGDALIFDHAKICDGASISDEVSISGHARVGGNSLICDRVRILGSTVITGTCVIRGYTTINGSMITSSKDVLVIGPIGSRRAHLTIVISDGRCYTGCFAGTIDELEQAARMKGRQDYLDLIPGIRALVNRKRGL